jgi:hypothetical protein
LFSALFNGRAARADTRKATLARSGGKYRAPDLAQNHTGVLGLQCDDSR